MFGTRSAAGLRLQSIKHHDRPRRRGGLSGIAAPARRCLS